MKYLFRILGLVAIALPLFLNPTAHADELFPAGAEGKSPKARPAMHALTSPPANSRDLVLNPSLAAPPDDAPPIVELLIPAAGAVLRELFSIEIHFSETVQGVDAADLLINGVAATNVTETAPGQFLFTFPQPPDGAVSVAWRADHNITDRSGTPHPFGGGNWAYALDAGGVAPGLQISEFMADNNRTLHDEDGDRSDWIEVFNSGATTANLDGWFLTDEPLNLTKWRFPNVAVPDNGYLLVFASEKNKTNASGRLHTNFKLSVGGEYLALVSPKTNVVSEFAPFYPKQFTDVSYGRAQGAPQTLGYFTQPTPGAPNTFSGPGFAPEVEFSQTSSTFTEAFNLALNTTSSNAIIRYTLDGNLPTNSSLVYVDPIPITNSVQVRTRAFQDGLFPGPPRSESFLLLSNNVLNFSSDLPVIIIHPLGKGTPSASRQTFANISVYEPVNGRTFLTSPPTLVTRAGIKVRGSSTEGYPKLSLAVEFWDEFNRDEDHEILGLPADADWVLYAPNNFEPVLIHNPFIHQLSRDIGRYSPRTRFVEVYLNKTTGPISAANYNGIYVLEEKIRIGNHRVDIDKLEPEHLKPPEVTGGYLLKIDRLDPGDIGFSAANQLMAYVDPKEREIRLPQRDPQEQYIRGYFTNFTRALSGTNWLDPNLGYAAYIDVDGWIDFHVIEVLSGNVDALVLSTYFHKPRDGKIVFGPHWDFDRALGSTDGRDANPRNWNAGPFFVASWWSRLFRDPDFWQKWIDRYQELRRSQLSRTYINALIDRLSDEVRQAQPRERQKWKVALRGGSFQSEINLMKNWLSNRIEFIDKQLVQPPVLSAGGGPVRPGFTIELSGPTNAAIFYTLDGSDPRLAQGGLSPLANPYTRPITLEANARIVARAHNPSQRQTGGPLISSPWSSPAAATFVVNSPRLIVTELMFHPEPAPAGSTNAASDFEFLELKNVGATPVDLVGFRFLNSIDFTFTSASGVTNLAVGERLVVAKSQAAFLARYPGISNIAGEYSGSLANNGNRLTLVGPLLEPVVDFNYDNNWQPLADGFGFSLVLADENVLGEQLTNSMSWRLSAKVGGSPGQMDAVPPVLPPIFINELLPNPGASSKDTVELFNPGTQPVDLAGWFLTDDYRAPKKLRLPSLLVPANGYLLLDDDDFRAASSGGFAFSKSGEDVYLFSADAIGNLTGWFHGFQFGPIDPGVSFGRYLKSTGAEAFVAQTRTTFRSANSGPRIGPIVINEILYQPAPIGTTNDNTSDEFIELRNITTQPVSLFDPAHSSNTWHLRGAIDFDFPPGITLPANSYAVVVGFDPQANAGALSTFRSRYGVDLLTRVFGPWLGHLDNTSGTIRLLRPDEPQLLTALGNTTVPHILVEQVAYANAPPWPADASATGQSLVRRDPNGFGDDPINWRAAAPSPGDTDSDGDGLPDRWEIAHGLNPNSSIGNDGADGDPDNDGFTNLEEFLSGTSPRDSDSFLELAAQPISAGVIGLTITAAPGRGYTIQYRDNLTSSRWQVLRTFVAPASGGAITLSDTLTNSVRFYRLLTP